MSSSSAEFRQFRSGPVHAGIHRRRRLASFRHHHFDLVSEERACYTDRVSTFFDLMRSSGEADSMLPYRLWVSMNGMAQVIGCLLMYGIGKNSGLSLAPWRTLFLVCGGLTCAAGFMFYFLMPNGPNDAWFLNAREKETLSLRMARDREGGDKTAFSVRQLKESLLDVKVWFVFAFGVLVTMQSPVLTVSLLSAVLPRDFINGDIQSSPRWSSNLLVTTNSRPCSTLRRLVQCRSPSFGSVSWVAGYSLETVHSSPWL